MHPGVALFTLVSLMTLQRVCDGHAMGPPEGACRSMIPGHDTTPQTTMAPYPFNFSDSCFTPGRSLRVSLAGLNGSVFRGFFVEARKPNDDSFSYGTFSSGGNPRIATIDCFNQSASAIGHHNQTGDNNFTIVTFEWTAPANVSNDVLDFVASVVLEFNTFWTGLRAPIAQCSDSRENSTLPGNNETSSNSTDGATSTTMTTATGNFTPATDGMNHTLSIATGTATSISNNNTVTITTASMTDQTTSGADRLKDSMLMAFSVASLASVRLLTAYQ